MPGGRGDPDRHLEDLATELGGARQLRGAAGQDDPGRAACRRPPRGSRCASSSNVSRIRASMIWQTSSRLTVRPGVLAEDRDADLLVVASTARRSHGAVADLELLGDLEARLEPDGDVVGDVVAADRQDARCGTASRPGTARGRSCPRRCRRPRRPSSFSVSDSDRLGRGERVGDELVDLDAGRGDALGQVLDRGRGRRDDVRLDLEAQGAHPERVLDALLAVDGEAAPLDVEHLAVRRDRDGAGDLDRAVDVLAGDLAVVGGDRDLAGRVEALDVLAADADEGPVDLPAGQPLGALDRVGDRADRLVDVDDDALLEAGRRHGAVAHDRQPAVAAHLADERADLARADVDADEDRFSFHRVRRLPFRARV